MAIDVSPGLVWREHHVGHDEEGSVLCRRHHVVRLVPHALVHVVPLHGDLLARALSQAGPKTKKKN